MNAVILAVVVMVGLSLARVSVIFALVAAALVGGLAAGMPIAEILSAFNDGLGGGAEIALAYATLGAFAVALSRSGLPETLAATVIRRLHGGDSPGARAAVKYTLLAALLGAGVLSQNAIPVHIAFIPILVPPLLHVMNRIGIDRRAVACVLTFGVTAPYMVLPVGFGAIFLEDILIANINQAGEASGFSVNAAIAPWAMLVPVAGMVVGLLTAVFATYRGRRDYEDRDTVEAAHAPSDEHDRGRLPIIIAAAAAVLTLGVQLYTDSMILGALFGFAVLSVTGIFHWREADDVFTAGVRMMALIGFIMIAASGFASVMQATGEIETLVRSSVELIGDNRSLAALIMLTVGLFITLGIGSSFSTIPIIAAIYVPLAQAFGFSPLATVCLVGTAAALGDAGSPASDSTLGPTAGLDADDQHDHIWDTVVPTFMHYNIPLLVFGWVGAISL